MDLKGKPEELKRFGQMHNPEIHKVKPDITQQEMTCILLMSIQTISHSKVKQRNPCDTTIGQEMQTLGKKWPLRRTIPDSSPLLLLNKITFMKLQRPFHATQAIPRGLVSFISRVKNILKYVTTTPEDSASNNDLSMTKEGPRMKAEDRPLKP